jgi:hypothetical protein
MREVELRSADSPGAVPISANLRITVAVGTTIADRPPAVKWVKPKNRCFASSFKVTLSRWLAPPASPDDNGVDPCALWFESFLVVGLL